MAAHFLGLQVSMATRATHLVHRHHLHPGSDGAKLACVWLHQAWAPSDDQRTGWRSASGCTLYSCTPGTAQSLVKIQIYSECFYIPLHNIFCFFLFFFYFGRLFSKSDITTLIDIKHIKQKLDMKPQSLVAYTNAYMIVPWRWRWQNQLQKCIMNLWFMLLNSDDWMFSWNTCNCIIIVTSIDLKP